MLTLSETVDFVYRKFTGMYREGQVAGEKIPAFLHSTSVMYAAIRDGITNPEILKGYCCHDLMEDTGATEDELREKIGDVATNIVLEMTYDPKLSSKDDYIKSFRQKSVAALYGKIEDRIENTMDFLFTRPNYAREYFSKAIPLMVNYWEREDEIASCFSTNAYNNLAQKIIVTSTKCEIFKDIEAIKSRNEKQKQIT